MFARPHTVPLQTLPAILLLLLAALLVRPAEAQRPNILFAIADDWSYGHAGAYGCDWVDTPNFDRLAREGILFTRAYTPNAKCAPSRAIILTGRNSWQLEAAGNHWPTFPAKFGGYVERLADHGYACGYTGKGWGPGFANDADGKKRAITGTSQHGRKVKPPAKGMSGNDYASNFADFLAAEKDGPWCFWYGTTEPHRGYQFRNGVENGGKKLTNIDRVPAYWPDNDTIRHDMLDYAMEVQQFDLHLGRILDHLEAAGQLDRTLIVATSDHGMPFPRAKGQAYDASNHIPLAIRWPRGIEGAGRVVNDYVSHADFAPTFLEAAGVKEPGPIMQPITGRSLFDIFGTDAQGLINPARDHVLIGKERHDIGRPDDGGYPIRGIVRDDTLYLKNFETDRWPSGNPETGYLNCDGSPTKTQILQARRAQRASKGAGSPGRVQRTHWDMCFGKRPAEELYDLRRDPDCVVNLATTDRMASTKALLSQQMVAGLKRQGDPRMFGKGDVFDRYPYANAKGANFHQKWKDGKPPGSGWVNPSDFEPKPLD